MTQIILLQRKEAFKAWKSASKHRGTKCSVEQMKCTVVPAQILYDPELKLRDFKRPPAEMCSKSHIAWQQPMGVCSVYLAGATVSLI